MGKLRFLAATAATFCTLAWSSANATPITYWFNGSFTDGATATGSLTLNTYGYLGAPTAITSTTGLFSGFTYALPADPSNINYPSDNIVVLSSPNYNRYLYLDFANSLALGGTDNLVTASSFECNGYATTAFACTANTNNVRYFTNGAAVPEPLTISIFGAGLLALGLFHLRRQQRLEVA